MRHETIEDVRTSRRRLTAGLADECLKNLESARRRVAAGGVWILHTKLLDRNKVQLAKFGRRW